jgi:hypothetical protein
MPPFVSGLALSRSFYTEAVRPILAAKFPALEYAAALIGSGSEVLGYDSSRSTDHHWGPRVMLFVLEGDLVLGSSISDALAAGLPATFRGYSTNFGQPDAIGVRLPAPIADGEPVAHRVDVYEPRSYFRSALGFDPLGEITIADWLMAPSQSLLEATAGEVFHDGPGHFAAARARLAWYPHDAWLHIMACQWQRISEEEAFVGRCAEAGDDVGSRIVAARIVRDLMRLGFLIERRYAPYSKWLGTAFATLDCAAQLAPAVARALDAQTYTDRERALCDAYASVAQMHNALGITDALDTTPRLYHDRPYQVIGADRFAAALRAAISDTAIRRLPVYGAIDQFVDNVGALGSNELRAALKNTR